MSELIFYHIPKCGGSSLRKMIYDVIDDEVKRNTLCPPYTNVLSNNDVRACTELSINREKTETENLKIILTHISYLPDLHPKLKITVLRNPIDRVISHYYFFEFRDKNSPLYNIELDNLYNNDRNLFNNYMCRYGNVMSTQLGIINCSGLLFEEYQHRIKCDGNQINKKIKERINEFNFICKLEYLNKYLDVLNRLLKKHIKTVTNLSEVVQNSSPYKKQCSYEIRNAIVELCYFDIMLYESFDECIISPFDI